MKEWECNNCGEVYKGDQPPEICPHCKASGDVWVDSWRDVKSRLDFPVKNFVDQRLITIDEEAPVMEAARLLKKNKVRSIIVTKQEKPIGIVTERDIVYKISTQDKSPSTSRINQIMSSPIVSITSDTPISKALKTMKKHDLRRLLVKEGGKPIGMITQEVIIGDAVTSDLTTERLKTPTTTA